MPGAVAAPSTRTQGSNGLLCQGLTRPPASAPGPLSGCLCLLFPNLSIFSPGGLTPEPASRFVLDHRLFVLTFRKPSRCSASVPSDCLGTCSSRVSESAVTHEHRVPVRGQASFSMLDTHIPFVAPCGVGVCPRGTLIPLRQ